MPLIKSPLEIDLLILFETKIKKGRVEFKFSPPKMPLEVLIKIINLYFILQNCLLDVSLTDQKLLYWSSNVEGIANFNVFLLEAFYGAYKKGYTIQMTSDRPIHRLFNQW